MRAMEHQIYAGPFEALEGRLLEKIAARQKEDPLAPVALLVGSNVLASYLKYRIAEQGRAAANLRFYTFLDLAGSLAAASPDQKKPRLPRLGPGSILDTILRQGGPAVFKEISAYPGFRAALLDTFRDLRDAGIAPEGLNRAIAEKSRVDRKEHLEGVARLFQEFRGKVDLFRDVDDDFHEALSNTPRARDILGRDHLLIYGIYDVTGQQEDLLHALKESLELIYFVPYCDEASSVFAKPFLEARAKELSVKPEPLGPLPDGRGSVVSGGIFDAKFSQGIRAGSLMLVLAPGESRVAVEIVREILRAVRDGVISGFHEAAILLRHPESEVPILSEAFRLRKIPFYLHGGVPLSQRPLTQAVRAIASLEADAFPRQAIFRAMEWIAAALPEDAAAAWDIPQWRALANDPVFLSGVQSWNLGVEALIKNGWRELKRAEELPTRSSEPADDEDPEKRALSVAQAQKRLEAAQALRRAWGVLRGASADWPQRLPWGEWATLLEQRLEPLLGGSEDWQAFTTALDEIRSLEVIAGTAGIEPRVGREQMGNALQDAMDALSRPEGRFQRSGVNVLSVTASRGLRFPLVIVPGLDEGKFPSRLRQDPFLLDEERRGIGRLPLKSLRVDEEKLLFDMAARSAEKRLVLIASRLDESSDRERIPSDFFLRAASAARGQLAGYNDLQEENIPGLRSVRLDSPAPAEKEVAVDEGEIRLRLVTSSPSGGRVLEALAELEPQRLRGPKAFDHARWKGALTPFDGRLQDPALVRWIAASFGPSAGPVSVSGLEEYARCPYLFFLKRALGLKKWEEVESAEGMEPQHRGQAIHEILEKFLQEFAGDRILGAAREALFASLDRHARQRLNEARPAGIPDLLWEIEQDRLLEMLHNWLDYELSRLQDGLLPSYFELPFGDFSPKQKSPAYRVETGNFVFDFRGRIDRLDLSRDGTRARVLDYKVGSLPSTMTGKPKTPLMGGEKMQIAVYRGALSALPEFSAVREVRGEYLHLQPKDGATAPCSLDAEVLAEAIDHLPAVLEVIGEGIEGGVFFARTSGSVRPGGHCEFCDYLTICGKDRTQREERKSGDPAVSRFVQMRMVDGLLEEEE